MSVERGSVAPDPLTHKDSVCPLFANWIPCPDTDLAPGPGWGGGGGGKGSSTVYPALSSPHPSAPAGEGGWGGRGFETNTPLT
jgi:hypothetical protein